MKHGSRRYIGNQVKYRDQDLKVIKLVWRELFGEDFKPDRKVSLEELVKKKIRASNFSDAGHIIKEEFNDKEVYYVCQSGHKIEISKDLNPLIILALTKNSCSYSIESNKVYILPLNQ